MGFLSVVLFVVLLSSDSVLLSVDEVILLSNDEGVLLSNEDVSEEKKYALLMDTYSYQKKPNK